MASTSPPSAAARKARGVGRVDGQVTPLTMPAAPRKSSATSPSAAIVAGVVGAAGAAGVDDVDVGVEGAAQLGAHEAAGLDRLHVGSVGQLVLVDAHVGRLDGQGHERDERDGGDRDAPSR